MLDFGHFFFLQTESVSPFLTSNILRLHDIIYDHTYTFIWNSSELLANLQSF